MSYHEDFLFYTEDYLNDRRGEPSPMPQLVCTDYTPSPPSQQEIDNEIRRLRSVGWSSVYADTKYQPFGMNHRTEYWGVK